MDQQIAKGRVEVRLQSRHMQGAATCMQLMCLNLALTFMHLDGHAQVNIGALSRDDIMDLVLKLKDNTTKLKSLRLVCMPK